jgi:Tfp pilus assembly protein PilW
MLILSALHRVARGERGFTLIETLVAMVTGLIVTGALFAILEVSLQQTARLTDVAQASQLGRTTLTRLVDELHSACLAPEFKPVQEGSTAKELIVVDAYSENAEITTAREDKIVWNETTKTLTDYARSSSSESVWPNFKFTAAFPSTGTVIGEDVAQTENSKKEVLPIFAYYSYAEKASTSPTAALSTLNEAEPLTGTLTKEKAEAEKAAAVNINFTTAPTGGAGEGSKAVQADASAPFTSQVTFAFSAPSSEATIADAPCK